MNASSEIDRLVSESIAPLLKSKGFKRRKLAFSRPFENGFDVFLVQKSSWNSRDDARFTINLGVYWTEAQKILGRVTTGFPFSDKSCVVFRRIGDIMIPRKDRWWIVSKTYPVEEIRGDVMFKIEFVTLPWFEKAHDLEFSIELVKEYKLINHIRALEALRQK
jgi:hypothetical protein